MLFPSLYESFGIPLVEALRNKCHIIASSGGATKEICDKNAFYFDPNDCEELISKLFLIKKKFPKVNFVKYPNKIIYNDWNKSINRIITIIENNFWKRMNILSHLSLLRSKFYIKNTNLMSIEDQNKFIYKSLLDIKKSLLVGRLGFTEGRLIGNWLSPYYDKKVDKDANN